MVIPFGYMVKMGENKCLKCVQLSSSGKDTVNPKNKVLLRSVSYCPLLDLFGIARKLNNFFAE